MAGWRSRDVRLNAATVNKLYMEGYLDDVYESNKYHGYRLSPKARLLLSAEAAADSKQTGQVESVPDRLFEDIVGHEETKELLQACLLAEKPVHVLLDGPPALAKSLFLWDIERAAGGDVLWLVGSGTSKGGLWDRIGDVRPRFVLIDELDKMNASDTAGLLSMMEGGRLVRAKVGREMSVTHEVRVVAAANRADLLSPELRSRFIIRKLRAYSREEYLTVVKGVLVRREGTSPELAEQIATGLDGRTQDVRKAVYAGRLVSQLGVEKAIRFALEGRGGEGV
ncbi:MAG: AAA family ATPase [Chloroflexi bacterium]|nr:AAA family ATPase [Chloroflexota bacterium]